MLNRYIAAPRMVLGYTRHDGVYLPLTRISNTTSIVGASKLDIHNNVFIGHYNFIEASHGITIHNGVQITNYVSITSHSSHNAIRLYGSHYIQYNGLHHGYVTGDISIGAYSFIGPHSVIMPNTRIGKGSVIAAYSLVKGEFPDFAIIAGNPAIQVGDTRESDEFWLTKYPELHAYYDEWAN